MKTMATSAGNVAAVDGQVSWPAMVAAHATVPKLAGGIAQAADQHVHRRQEGSGQGSGGSGNDELTTPGYGHGIRL